MKKCVCLLALALTVLASCGPSQKELDNVNAQLKSSKDSINNLKKQLKEKDDEIKKLSFPADQRLSKIKKDIEEKKYKLALSEIDDLTHTFPNSEESALASQLKETVSGYIAAEEAEKERIKALGFKGLQVYSTVEIDNIKAAFSSFSVGSTYTHDAYDSQYFYNTADKGYCYLSAAMNVTSESSDPNIPEVALYSISGSKLVYEGRFFTNFARWEDYGSYLGNYHDNGNDFSKVSTVRFKIGCHANSEVFKKPYIVLVKNVCKLERKYEKFENPPVSYVGTTDYPYTLKLEDFDNNEYYAIKIANL